MIISQLAPKDPARTEPRRLTLAELLKVRAYVCDECDNVTYESTPGLIEFAGCVCDYGIIDGCGGKLLLMRKDQRKNWALEHWQLESFGPTRRSQHTPLTDWMYRG